MNTLKTKRPKILSEKLIIIRSSSKLKSYTITVGTQRILGFMLFLGFGWTIFTTLAYISAQRSIHEYQYIAENSKIAYKDLFIQLIAYRDTIAQSIRELSETHEEEIETAQKIINLEHFSNEMEGLDPTRYRNTQASLQQEYTRQDDLQKNKISVFNDISWILSDLNDHISNHKIIIKSELGEIDFALAKSKLSEKRLLEERNNLQYYVVELNSVIKEKNAYEKTLVDKFADLIDERIETITKNIHHTGIPLESFLQEYRKYSGQGGPYNFQKMDLSKYPTLTNTKDLEKNYQQWKEMESLAKSLPLSSPIRQNYRKTSGFGNRIDPFTGAHAMHKGTDFAAEVGTPIYATGPGIVTHAGIRGAYGLFVEIDHGLGIKSRYAHLNSVKVNKGDHVTKDSPIATLGSTGRSTGPHLHYEIIINRKHTDPDKYLNAGRKIFTETPVSELSHK